MSGWDITLPEPTPRLFAVYDDGGGVDPPKVLGWGLEFADGSAATVWSGPGLSLAAVRTENVREVAERYTPIWDATIAWPVAPDPCARPPGRAQCGHG